MRRITPRGSASMPSRTRLKSHHKECVTWTWHRGLSCKFNNEQPELSSRQIFCCELTDQLVGILLSAFAFIIAVDDLLEVLRKVLKTIETYAVDLRVAVTLWVHGLLRLWIL